MRREARHFKVFPPLRCGQSNALAIPLACPLDRALGIARPENMKKSGDGDQLGE